ncbi:MAG: V-type ATP synthase subunit A, partial [Symbiobacteriaceae bacterium]|nr:V-type ATP synthase subunit A [Symbiobacteriaceae bacterium]
MANEVFSVNGPVVRVRQSKDFALLEMVYVGHKRLIGEVIGVNEQETTIQVYEPTTGLSPGEPVVSSGGPQRVTLGPGMLCAIYDGIQRPLKDMPASDG